MMHFHRLTAAGAAAAAAAALTCVTTSGASAAPDKSPRAETFAITCAHGTFLLAPPPGNGEWTPGLFVGTHQVLVPYRFTYVFDDGTNIETETVTKKAPMPKNSVTCSFSVEFVEGGNTYTISGTAKGPLRGKP